MNQLKYALDEQIIDNSKFDGNIDDTLNFLRFYGEILFSLCKGLNTTNSVSNKSKESQHRQ